MKVTDCNASNFSYQWMRDGEPIKGAVYNEQDVLNLADELID